MNTEVILKAEELYFSYDDGKSHSLNGLSLEIKKGRKIAFLGANGSGKSTFFRCCNGILKPNSGTLYFHGKPVDYSRKGLLNLRSKVGIVFQDPDNQLFSASVYQEISFGALNIGYSVEQTKEEVEAVISRLEITPFRHKPTHALSGGQKKQVSIADIIVMHPEIMILDEPAAALDPKHSIIVNKIVDQLTEAGITVMISTHDVDYAFRWADDVFLFKDGKVLLHGSPEDVFVNKSILSTTNLEQPVCIQLFDSLCKKGILKTSLPIPRTLHELESYIEKTTEYPYYGATSIHKPTKKAILLVSFGTSFAETRKKTLDVIQSEITNTFTQYTVYCAWTSKKIIEKIQKRDGIQIHNVKEAMQKMLDDGITDVIIQPTHVINGIENDLMKEDALSFQKQFHKISFGAPLLTSAQDNMELIEAINCDFPPLKKEDALVLIGHGTTHYSNSIYAALDYTFKANGYKNIHLGTVEAYPSMENILALVKEQNPKHIYLAPFMIVAGEHAKNDMASDQPDSWKSQFEAAGFQTDCILKGLGEYKSIRDIFIRHVKEAIATAKE